MEVKFSSVWDVLCELSGVGGGSGEYTASDCDAMNNTLLPWQLQSTVILRLVQWQKSICVPDICIKFVDTYEKAVKKIIKDANPDNTFLIAGLSCDTYLYPYSSSFLYQRNYQVPLTQQ